MALPTVTLSGNLVADPDLTFTNAGKAFVSIRVACNAPKRDAAGNWVDGDTTYVNVVAWREAEAIAAYSKGTRVAVQGSLKQRDYETREGEKRTAYEVNATWVAEIARDRKGSAAALWAAQQQQAGWSRAPEPAQPNWAVEEEVPF